MMKKQKLFVLALDGVPHSLLQNLMAEGLLPNFEKLRKKGRLQPMHSVNPPLSSVAWASFMTGKMPAEHGISGFVERNPQTMEWFVPNASNLKAPTLFQELSQRGKRIFVMNVPLTFPPPRINGIVIAGFLAPDLTRATHPPALGQVLKARGYIIDADVEKGKQNPAKFLEILKTVLEKRLETMWKYYQQEDWDFFMAHIMETDRLHHFFWKHYADNLQPYAEGFRQFYREIDRLIGAVLENLKKDSELVVLSDHGFTTVRYQVYLNRWLAENGYLYWEKMPPENLKDMHAFSRAYSLYPGRVYINLKGREKEGSVKPGPEYETLCQELEQKLLQLKDPDGKPVIEKVVRGYQVYGLPEGEASALFVDPLKLDTIPDLFVVPRRGYDLKGDLWAERLFAQTVFTGMHTFDDAFFFTTVKEAFVITSIKEVYDFMVQFYQIR